LILKDTDFVFEPPPVVSRARRVLIKPAAGYPEPYPQTTSREMLLKIIEGIRRVSDADILLLEGTATGEPVKPFYQALHYDFPRILTLDVRDCVWVEVDNPLAKPLAVPTFWIPNVILSSDYLITVVPLKEINCQGRFSLMNLLTLLPVSKYGKNWSDLYRLGIDKVVADLYFTLPFDLGIIEAQQKYTVAGAPACGQAEEYGKVFIGDPYDVDSEASELLGLKTEYVDLIQVAKVLFEE